MKFVKHTHIAITFYFYLSSVIQNSRRLSDVIGIPAFLSTWPDNRDAIRLINIMQIV